MNDMILQKELLHHFEWEHLSRGVAGGGLPSGLQDKRQLRAYSFGSFCFW